MALLLGDSSGDATLDSGGSAACAEQAAAAWVPPPPWPPRRQQPADDWQVAAALQQGEVAAAAAAAKAHAAASVHDWQLAAELQEQEDAAAAAAEAAAADAATAAAAAAAARDEQLARQWQEEEDARVAAALAAEEESAAVEAATAAAAASSANFWSALHLHDAEAAGGALAGLAPAGRQQHAAAAARATAAGGSSGTRTPDAFPSLQAAAGGSRGGAGGVGSESLRQALLRDHRAATQRVVERGSGVRLLHRAEGYGSPAARPPRHPGSPACGGWLGSPASDVGSGGAGGGAGAGGLPPLRLDDGGQLLEDDLDYQLLLRVGRWAGGPHSNRSCCSWWADVAQPGKQQCLALTVGFAGCRQLVAGRSWVGWVSACLFAQQPAACMQPDRCGPTATPPQPDGVTEAAAAAAARMAEREAAAPAAGGAAASADVMRAMMDASSRSRPGSAGGGGGSAAWGSRPGSAGSGREGEGEEGAAGAAAAVPEVPEVDTKSLRRLVEDMRGRGWRMRVGGGRRGLGSRTAAGGRGHSGTRGCGGLVAWSACSTAGPMLVPRQPPHPSQRPVSAFPACERPAMHGLPAPSIAAQRRRPHQVRAGLPRRRRQHKDASLLSVLHAQR